MTDQLGSARVLENSLGEVVSRRDFMPFGKEITPDGTHRKADLKYNFGDNIRQKFTGYQKDSETQLDFAEARMQSATYFLDFETAASQDYIERWKVVGETEVGRFEVQFNLNVKAGNVFASDTDPIAIPIRSVPPTSPTTPNHFNGVTSRFREPIRMRIPMNLVFPLDNFF